tara:strand:- start:5730 stop:6626 length:897 start_codon:yes stop_codon:yes gene_type:complete
MSEKENYDKNKEALELSNGNEPLVAFSDLSGIQSKLTQYIFDSCLKDPNGISEKLTIKELSETSDTSAPSVKKSILRLRDKNVLFKGEYKDGRGGWTQYVVNRTIFDEMNSKLETVDEASSTEQKSEEKTVDESEESTEKENEKDTVDESLEETVDKGLPIEVKVNDTKKKTSHKSSKHHDDEHHDDHTFPSWVTFGEEKNPESAFIKIFAWLVFWTILEVLAIVQEFEAFWMNMAILFGIALIKCWFICSFFMHMTWDPPLVNQTAAVPLFFLIVLFLAVGLTSPGAVDDLRTICGF